MNNRKNIIHTIAYSDIFNFPLTLTEIHKFYHGEYSLSKNDLKEELKNIPAINHENGYYFLSGRQNIVLERKFAEKESEPKIKKAKRITRLLACIPTIRYIGLSGSLALKNAKHNDDMDLFIVTSRSTVWLTRFAVLLFLITIGQKRKKGVFKAPDKICPNMIVAEDAVCLPEAARSLYTARELVQLRTLVAKGITQEDLISRNSWIKNFLPNSRIHAKNYKQNSRSTKEKVINILDDICFYLQKKYMGEITNETIKKNIAKFHPRKTGEYIMQLYSARIKLFDEEKNNITLPQRAHIPTYKN